MKKHIFTLVEMLVVVAVIAIIASMLLPALSKARNKTKDIQCINNLRQIGASIALYTGDHDDLLPPWRGSYQRDSGAAGNEYWPVFLSKYLSRRQKRNGRISAEFLCPRDPAPFGREANGEPKRVENFDFGYTNCGSYGAGIQHFPYNSGIGKRSVKYNRIKPEYTLVTDNVFLALCCKIGDSKFPQFSWHDANSVNRLRGDLSVSRIFLIELGNVKDNQ